MNTNKGRPALLAAIDFPPGRYSHPLRSMRVQWPALLSLHSDLSNEEYVLFGGLK